MQKESGQKMLPKKNRIWEIDVLRGILILLVVFDHTMYDFVYFNLKSEFWLGIQNFAKSYENSVLRYTMHEPIVYLFIILSGVSCVFSRDNLRRALKTLIFALGITLATVLLEDITGEPFAIWFGIIQLFAACQIICALLEKIKTPAPVLFLLCIISLVVGYCYVNYPAVWTGSDWFSFIVENNRLWEFSQDPWPLLPGLGWFLFGLLAGRVIYREKKSVYPIKNEYLLRPLMFCGRHSLVIYILNQVIVFGGLWLIIGK